MTAKIDQKAYLQKYLTGTSDKKKKKKKTVKGKGFKIIDDDLDLSKLQELQGDDLDILDQGEDAPQIAGIIDERPEEVRKAELFQSSTKWRVVTQDDGFNSKLQIEEIKRDIKEVEKDNEVIFGKMYSDSEDDKKNDSDPSPPRKQSKEKHSISKKPRSCSDSDFSPPRRKESNKSHMSSHSNKNYDSDLSPPRKQMKNYRNDSPLRKNSASTSKNISEKSKKHRDRKSRWDDNVDKLKNNETSNSNSPKRSKKIDANARSKKSYNSSDFDISPPLRSEKYNKTRKNSTSDSDISPPRKQQKHDRKTDESKRDRRSKNQNNSDSDLSPPRNKRKDKHKERNRNGNSKTKYDSDSSPRRKDKRSRNKDKYISESDSDLSPPRKHRKEKRQEDLSPPRRDKRKEYKQNSDSPPPSNKKMAKTLEGKLAGLQDAGQLREENEAFRRREDEAYKRLTDDVSGRNAKTVSRKSKRETSEERQKQREKAERQKELDEKYKKWSRGLKQIEAQEERVQDYMREAAKPLARYKDDQDLEHRLKDVERDGDPMLNYIRERKRERGELAPAKPAYKGNFPPNRFNIRPGYRWDGVDRSNGYEKKLFDQRSKKKAMEEDAYKWSTEDL